MPTIPELSRLTQEFKASLGNFIASCFNLTNQPTMKNNLLLAGCVALPGSRGNLDSSRPPLSITVKFRSARAAQRGPVSRNKKKKKKVGDVELKNCS